LAIAIGGIPLTLLYLSQVAKVMGGLLEEGGLFLTAIGVTLLAALLIDLVEDTAEDTPFIDALWTVFLQLSTIGTSRVYCASTQILLILVSIPTMSLVSMSVVAVEKEIEKRTAGCELKFSQLLGRVERWMAGGGLSSSSSSQQQQQTGTVLMEMDEEEEEEVEEEDSN